LRQATNQKAGRARILVVEDHASLRAGLALMIGEEEGFSVCGDVGDAPSALEAAQKLQPDLVLFDITLEKVVRVDLIPEFHRRAPGTRVLVLSAHPPHLYARRCLDAGALGYVDKLESFKDVVRAIRAVLRGRVFVKGDRTANDEEIWSAARMKPVALDSLSNRELQIFMMIGMGKSARDVSDALALSLNTVEAHRENIRRKFGLSSAEEVLCYAVIWVNCRGIG